METDSNSRSTSADYPKKRIDVNSRSIDHELVILDRQNGSIHQLNQTAGIVWVHCDGRTSVQEIAMRITDLFEVDLSSAIGDVEKAIHQLNDIGLLEPTLSKMRSNTD
jgi:hypothetical protein